MIDNYYHGMTWVPVAKRMPEPLFPEKYLTLLLCLNNRTFVCGGFDEGKFWLDGQEIDNVTHWQYVPLTPDRGGLVEQ
ncbi:MULTISPECIES: hypothetical protein [Klebsiella/Raoultella group]|uniref:hypothetical protein n=1 Tax=Enterobacteriaceae TaxID=543 RepID=UPI001115283B|nr:hypothetical protein [Klebsiella michiganensis]EMB3264473.1 hypothetical protein [Klebsiella michiganensis]WAT41959.1 hypothetical protein OEE44_10070 [Klebsiella michiganensis]HBS6341486.1 hypothetical protein [Klebsiella pneumoniae]